MTTMPQPMPTQVTVGVDTHADIHVAVAKDPFGRRLDATSVATTPAGYAELLDWAQRLGQPDAWSIEGTGSFGAGLVRFLRAEGQVVVEVNRPDRSARRRRGKSDPLDAEAAARTAQAQQGSIPKAGDGQVEMIRVLRVARATAMKARTQAVNALKAPVVTAPAGLREPLRSMSTVRLVQTTAALEPGPVTTPVAAATLGLGTLARRYQALSAELAVLDAELDRLTRAAAPKLVALFGVGADSAGALLVAAGDNPDRLRSDAAFAMRCGASPIEASRARPAGIGSIGVGTARPTRRCTRSWWRGCVTTNPPRTTWPAGSVRASPKGSHPLSEALCGPGGVRGPATMSQGDGLHPAARSCWPAGLTRQCLVAAPLARVPQLIRVLGHG
jgi:transposase